jgi:hypothetical protein
MIPTRGRCFSLVWDAGACVLLAASGAVLAGRDSQALVRVIHPAVSRRQGLFEWGGEGLAYRSADVTVASVVRGEQVWGRVQLNEGDVVDLAGGQHVTVGSLAAAEEASIDVIEAWADALGRPVGELVVVAAEGEQLAVRDGGVERSSVPPQRL